MSAGFTKQLKLLIWDFVVDGEILEKPLGRAVKNDLDSERVEFLRLFIDLLLNSNYMSEETKIYLSDRYITMEGVQLKLEERGIDVNINTVKSKVWNDKKKIITDFGEDLFGDIIRYRDVDMASYMDKLNRLQVKYNNVSILKNIDLNLRLDDTSINKSITEEEFQEFLGIIAPYSKRHRRFISDNIPRSMVGYAMYLLSNNMLFGDDLERKNTLLELLGD